MLKRTMILLGLSTVVAALLLAALGCGGHNGTTPTIESQDAYAPNRQLGNASVTFSANPHPIVTVSDSDGIKSIQLQWLVGTNAYRKFFYPNGATTFQFELSDWGKATYYTFAVVDSSGMRDSRWAITSEGEVIRVR